MLTSLKKAILFQVAVFFFIFTVFFALAQDADYPENYFEVLLFYMTWIPAFWGGGLGGFGAYLTLGLLAVVSIILGIRTKEARWWILCFHFTASLWTLFPTASYVFGTYRGP